MRGLGTIDRQLALIEHSMLEEVYPITGFSFVEDIPGDREIIYKVEKGMPLVQGFLYEFEGNLYGELIKKDR